MPDNPDMQWCFPLRRQQAGVAFPARPKASGATKLQASTLSAKLAMNRRIVVDASTSQGRVTSELVNDVPDVARSQVEQTAGESSAIGSRGRSCGIRIRECL